MKRLFTTLLMVACLCGLLFAQIAPINLTGTAQGQNVTLNWSSPEATFTWATDYDGGVGAQGSVISVAQRYSHDELVSFGVMGLEIIKVGFVPMIRAGEGNLRVKFYVWTPSTTGNNPGAFAARYPNNDYVASNPATYVEYTTAHSGFWQDVVFTTSVPIPADNHVWIGYTCLQYGDTGYPAGNDDAVNNPALDPRNMIKMGAVSPSGDNWQTAHSANAQFRFNWMIRGTASYPTLPGAPQVSFGHELSRLDSQENFENAAAVIPGLSFMPATQEEKDNFIADNTPTRAFAGYKVYRGEWGSPSLVTLTASPITARTYTDVGAPNNMLHAYHVTTVTTSPDGESTPATVEVAVGDDPIITIFPYIQNFDYNPVVWPPNLWTVLSNNDPIADNWMQGSNVLYAYSGYGTAISRSWDSSAGALNPDELFISPHLTKPALNAQSMYLSFQARNSETGQWFQKFTVMKSTTGKLFTDFSPIGSQYSLEGIDGWKGFLIDLTNEIPNGSNFYIAIRHHDSSDQVTLMVDNFRIDVVPTANTTFHAPASVSSSITGSIVTLNWQPPSPQNSNLAGYKIYCDGLLLGSTNATTTTYANDVIFNGDYLYEVTAVYNAPPAESDRTAHTANVTTGRRYLFDITNIRHTLTAEGDAIISWDPPQEGNTVNLSHIGSDDPEDGAIITWSNLSDMTFGHRYDEDDLQAFGVKGGYIESVGFAARAGRPHQSPELVWTSVEYKIMIFNGSYYLIGEDAPDGTHFYDIGELVYEQDVDVSQLVDEDWADIKLHSPVQIPLYSEIIIAISVKATSFTPQTPMCVLTDGGPYHLDKGDLYLNLGGNYCYSVLGGSMSYSFLIRASVIKAVPTHTLANIEPMATTPVSLNRVSMGRPSRITMNPAVDFTHKSNTQRGITTTIEPAFIKTRFPSIAMPEAYRVYIGAQGTDPVLPPDGQVTQPTYTATGLTPNTYRSRITAIYGSAPNQVETSAIEYLFYAGSVTIDEFPYTHSFEEALFPPPGWAGFNTGTGGVWFKQASSTAHDGGAVAATTSLNSWLVTPRLRLPQAWTQDSPVTFYARRGGSTTELLNVYYTTEGPNPESTWNQLGGQQTVSSGNWVLVTRYVPSAVNGSSVWVAIRKSGGQDRLEIDSFMFTNPDTTGVIDESLEVFPNALIANYPNPFNPETTIAFSLAKEGHVTLDIFNVKGQKVSTLLSEVRKSGLHKVVWNGKDNIGHDVASGIYFYRLNVGNFEETRKMILMK